MYDQGWVNATGSNSGRIKELEKRIAFIENKLGFRYYLIRRRFNNYGHKLVWHVETEFNSCKTLCGTYGHSQEIKGTLDRISTNDLESYKVCKHCLKVMESEEI